jgi:hypothetical protein
MAERRVIRASEDSVNGQAIRGSTHPASIPDRLRLSPRNSRLTHYPDHDLRLED